MDENENVESEMRALFGITEGTDTEPSTQVTPNNSTETVPVENTDSTPTDATTDSSKPTESQTAIKQNEQYSPEDKFNKSNSAFAQMRIQNKSMSDLIMDLAKATGQQPKDITEAQHILKDSLTKVMAKNSNIPEDILREMSADKQALAELKQAQAKQKALAGFQAVKDMHNLTKDDINNFADKLIEKNINPFEQEVDLVKEYRNMYFDALITKAKEEGVQEERARSMKAQQSSTSPDLKRGVQNNTGTENPIKTVAELNALLDGLK